MHPAATLVALLLLCTAPALSALTALPAGTWLATPMLPINYINSGTLTVLNATLAVSADTGSFKFYGTFTTNRGTTVRASFAGEATCADGATEKLLFSVLASSCSSTSPEISWFCSTAPTAYSGTFAFGINGAAFTLLVDRWGGAEWPFIFTCAHPPCSYSSACNNTLTIQTLLYATDSTVVLNGTDSNVIFQAGSSTNNNITILGDTVTVADSQVTLQQSPSSTSTTVNLGGEGSTNEVTFVTQNNTNEYNFYTTAPASCRSYASVSASRTANLTLSTTAFTRVTFTSSSLDTPGSDWSLSPDSSTLRFLGDSDADAKYAYALQACVHLALLYSPSPVGVALVLQLFNRTTSAVAIGMPVQSAVIYNHTNPALLTSVCATTLVSGLYTDNIFGIYATLETTDLSVYTAPLGLSTWSLTATPLACKGNEININITANFTNGQLEEGTCIDITNPDTKTVRISNPGLCGLQVPEPALDTHASEGVLKHMWHKLKNVFVAGYTTLTGTVRLLDTTNIKVLNTNGNDVEFQFRCPIDCGTDPIKTNSTCDCKDGVNTEGSCTCGESVSTPGSCTCEQGVETPSVETPTGDPVSIPQGVETPKINTPDGTPLEVPQGVETPTVSGPDGLPVDFPTGARFNSPMPVMISFDPRQASISSISSTGPGTTSNPNDPGSTIGSFGVSGPSITGPGGPCEAVRIELRNNEPLIGIDKRTGRRVKLIGSVVHSAVSAASSAGSAATSAASSGAAVATKGINVVTTVLGTVIGCIPGSSLSLASSGGVPLPGVPGVPSTPNVGPDPYPSSLSGASASAAFDTSTTSTPQPGTTEAAAAAAVTAAITGSPLPPGSPTVIEVWTGGLTIPIFNDSLPLPPCSSGSPDRGRFGVLKTNGTTDDAAIMCLNQPSKGGWGYYPFPTSERLVTDIFSANSTAGLKCNPGFCSITAYPNGTLFALDGTPKLLPGSCSFCNMQWDKYGNILAASSGNITAYNRSFSYDQTLTYYTDSGIIMDVNSTIVNAGTTVLNQTLIQDVNITGTALLGGLPIAVFQTTTSTVTWLGMTDSFSRCLGFSTNSPFTIIVQRVGLLKMIFFQYTTNWYVKVSFGASTDCSIVRLFDFPVNAGATNVYLLPTAFRPALSLNYFSIFVPYSTGYPTGFETTNSIFSWVYDAGDIRIGSGGAVFPSSSNYTVVTPPALSFT